VAHDYYQQPLEARRAALQVRVRRLCRHMRSRARAWVWV
jgi:hypothetical protein